MFVLKKWESIIYRSKNSLIPRERIDFEQFASEAKKIIKLPMKMLYLPLSHPTRINEARIKKRRRIQLS